MWINKLVTVQRLVRGFSLRYSKEHEWIKYDETSKTGIIGITDYAQGQLGDLVHISLPKTAEKYKVGDVMSTIESVKVVADIYAPASGTITEVNKEVEKTPEIINQSPELNGWILKMSINDSSEISKLMDKKTYDAFVSEIQSKGH